MSWLLPQTVVKSSYIVKNHLMEIVLSKSFTHILLASYFLLAVKFFCGESHLENFYEVIFERYFK
jgi:hypothetical protein